MRVIDKTIKTAMVLAILASNMSPAWAFYGETRQPHNQAVENLMTSGMNAEKKGNLVLAEKYYKLAEATCKSLKGYNQDQLADVYSLLEKLYRQKHKYDASVDYAQKVVELDTNIYGPEHVFVAESLKLLGDIESEAKKYEDARKTYAKAIDVANKSSAMNYRWCIDAAHANVLKKMDLILSCYDAYCRTYEAEDDPTSADDAYKSAIDKCARFKDKEISAKDLQIGMYDRYRDYLSRTKREQAKDSVDQEYTEVERRGAANREYKSYALPK